MKKRAVTLFFLLCICVSFLIPVGAVLAQSGIPEFIGPLVPCGIFGERGPYACNACQLVTLAQNIINFLIFLATIAAVAMFVYAGFLYLTAVGDSGKIKQAHSVFVNVLVGFIILLAAWLIIDTIMKTFFAEEKSGFGPWEKILCKPPGVTTP